MIPPKPAARPDKVSLWRYLRLFRADLLSAQPARLYRAWMAEFRTPFFRSYLCNDPALVRLVLTERPADFPKSRRIKEGLTPLLGNSVFVTNGPEWERQRRLIDPAFEGGRLRDIFPAMRDAAEAAVARMPVGPVEAEAQMSHATADIIFRTLFSIPIDHQVAAEVFRLFRDHQRGQPILNLAAILPFPTWVPRLHRRRTVATAAQIRALISGLVSQRAKAIADGNAPDDLATKIMTARDPQTGQGFTPAEMVDQVAIFFLAGHETSASALSWALMLLAMFPEVQDRVAAEADALPERPEMAELSRLRFTRDVFRETLRLYPPVPMMVRETVLQEHLRGREVQPGAQVVLSSWHLHRHERLWDNPDAFDPDRWQTEAGRASAHEAYIPFSAGPRVCPGMGFATIEGALMLATLVRAFRFDAGPGAAPVPVAHLTVRAREGIALLVSRRR
ncbi:MAG: cytochrome P450 [Cereibacter sphaeroides]|uniref:Cytochrome P450 n=1 Tax=Cereibacter sphaeroides TaxID=1063 RepID=A0A2W5UN57_CERSP|nr:MAG: cytochrome P450 [Cereibacter sphaeroides]